MGTDNLAPGTVLGRYELLLPIASGGMATVWVARAKGTRGFSKMVAVKTILPNLSDDPTFEQMFLDEATIASKIQHPNVAQIIDLGEQDETLYLAMEWVDGESLSTLSKFARKNGTDIPLRVGTKILAQACAGLHAAHELTDDDDRLIELVHRDVSPQNILVSSTGVVKIVDFGVAKALGRTGETTAGQLKGKVPFMSPEQAKGANVDRRTDVFALGIILYRVATGAHPFLDETDIKTMRNIITRPVMPPRVKNASCPVELERIILKALQKDPDKRYQTAHDLELELENFLSSSGGAVATDDVATFVRSTLGDRDRKRKATIRDAVLKLDEARSNGRDPSVPPESVSGVMMTKLQTPPSSLSSAEVTQAVALEAPTTISAPAEASAERTSTVPASLPAAALASSPPGDAGRTESAAPERPALASQTPPPHSEAARSVSSPTLAAMAVHPSVPPPKSHARWIVVSAAAAALVAGIALVAGRNSEGPRDATGAAEAKPAERQPELAAASPTDAPRTSPTGSDAPIVLDAATDATALPDNPPKTTAPFKGNGGAHATATASAAPGAPPSSVAVVTPPVAPPPTAPATPPTKPTATTNVPTVQDPGF